MSKINILIFSSLYPSPAQPRHGVFLENRIRHYLSDPDVNLQVVAPVPWFPFKSHQGQYGAYARTPKYESRHGIPVHHPRYLSIPKIGMDAAPMLMAKGARRTLERIRASGFNFDIIDAYYMYPDAVAANRLAKEFSCPVIATAFGSDLNVLTTFAKPRRMIAQTCHEAHALTAVSDALADKFKELGADEHKVHTILHGVDLKMFHPGTERDLLRQELNIRGTSLLCVGHLLEAKGQHLVIEALQHLPYAELIIAGHGPDENKLKSQVRQLGLVNRVRFLGNVLQPDLAKLYSACDILVLPSAREGIPNVIMEAMASGMPVIATAVGGIPEVMAPPLTGQLLTARTANAICRAVEVIISAPVDRANIRHHAETFNWEDTAKQHLKVLRDVVSQSRDTSGSQEHS